MFRSLNKKRFSGLLATLSLVAVNFSLAAQDGNYTHEYVYDAHEPYEHYEHHNYDHFTYDHDDHYDHGCCCNPCGCNGFYIGGFGGVVVPGNHTHITQMGTAFFTEAQGGPLAVDARGNSNIKTSGIWGLQVGYEWNRSSGCISPAIELEGLFFNNQKAGTVTNQLSTNRLDAHDFNDSFSVHSNVYLLNGVFTFNNYCWGGITPYFGAGIGLAKVTIRNALSTQTAPTEVSDFNHFNSKGNDSSWTLAGQLKAGLRYHLCGGLRLFGEYRLAYLDTSRFILGSTAYPNHAPTSPWNVDLKGTYYNAFVLGLQYEFGN